VDIRDTLNVLKLAIGPAARLYRLDPRRLVASAYLVVLFVVAGAASAAVAESDERQARRAPAQVLRFSGNGGKTLSPFRVRTPSTMLWTNTGQIFQIFNSGSSNDGSVNSSAHRGTSFIPAGRYRLQVNAIGTWTVVIRPGAERLSNPIRFRGNGAKALPPFRLARGKTMRWTNTGQIFQTFSSGLNGNVNSQARRGTTYLPPGRYALYVNAIGNWTIEIT
jgi:hypothetical protein